MDHRPDSIKALCLALGLACVTAVLVAVSENWPTAHRLALLAAGPGVLFLAVTPNTRLTLAGTWIFLHPLSIERVFPLGSAFQADFFPPVLVVSASDVALLLLVGLLLLERLAPGNRQPRPQAALIPLLLLAVWGACLTVRGLNGTAGILAALQGFKMVVFMAALSLSIRSRREFQFILFCMGLAVAIQVAFIGLSLATSSAISLSTRPAGELLPFTGPQGEAVGRATGTVGHTNEEASFLAFFGLPLLALLGTRNAAWRIAALLLLAATGVALVLTYSRSAWLSVSVGLAVVAWVSVRRHRLGRKVLVMSVPVLCFGLLVVLFNGQRIYDRLVHGDEGATSFRQRAIRLALSMAEIEPVTGVGPGGFARAALSFFPASRKVTRWTDPASLQADETLDYGLLEVTPMAGKDDRVYMYPLLVHNKLLLLLVEQGAVGLCLFLAFLFMVWRRARRELDSADPWISRAAVGLLGAFWASLVYMQLDLYANDKSMQILLTVPALILALGRMQGKAKAQDA